VWCVFGETHRVGIGKLLLSRHDKKINLSTVRVIQLPTKFVKM
jgi:hypothetical protein